MMVVAVGLLGVMLAACAAPTITASAMPVTSATATTPPPSSSPVAITHIVVICPGAALSSGGPEPSPDSCSSEEAAVLAAVAEVGHTGASLTILPMGFLCGAAFYGGTCPVPQSRFPVAAYATFLGTDLVAALSLTRPSGGPYVATLVALRVPPAGWQGP